MKHLRILSLGCLVLALLSLSACSSGKSGKDGKDDDERVGKKFGKYTLHALKYDDASRSRCKDNAADVLTQLAGQDDVCMIGLWAYNPPAILNAVKSSRKEGKVKIVGFDEDEATLKGIKDGHIHATVVQNPYMFGYGSVQVMAALAGAPKAKMPPEAKDELWHIPHEVITKANVEEFHEKLKKRIEEGRSADPRTKAGAIKVAFVSNNEEDFWHIANAGTRKAAEDFEVEVLFRRPKAPTVGAQKQVIQDVLNEGVKAIAVSVINPKDQRSFLNEVAEKAILVCVDNDAPDTKRKLYIGTDNVKAGRAVGAEVKKAMPGGGTIAIFVGQPDPINAKERTQGVLDELEGK